MTPETMSILFIKLTTLPLPLLFLVSGGFDAPDDAQLVAQAIAASTIPNHPELDPTEGPVQRKCRKVDPSILIGSTRSLEWQPHREDDPDDDAPTSMA